MTVLVLLMCAVLAGCARYDEGVRAYERGEHERARDIFAAFVQAEGDSASPALLHHLALASLQMDDLEGAVVAAERAGEHGGAFVGLRDFVLGSVAMRRAEAAAVQARAVEAEPFAFDLAIRQADIARASWGRAAGTRDEWPAACRNAERAWLRAEAFRKEKAEAEKTRQRRTAAGGAPKVNLVQQPPQKTADERESEGDDPPPPGKNDDAPEEAVTLIEGELPQGQIMSVLETLRAKEDEKLAARRARRRAASSKVEKDW